jgi:hypothetical protein
MWVKRLIAVLAGVLLLLALFAAWTVFRVKADLARAAEHATGLRVAVQRGDEPQARADLTGLQDASASARQRTDGPVFAALSRLPSVGDDLAGVRTISSSLDNLAADALAPLVTAAEKLDAGSFTPRDGRISIEAISSLQAPVSAGADGFAAADADLAAVDSAGFVAPLRTPFNELRRTIRSGASGLHAADTAAKILPGMLGEDGARKYLLVVQSNAEVRATGGLPGSVSLLETNQGKVELTGQMAGSDFKELKQPILPLTEEELSLYDRQLGTYFVDANFTPDFPRAAQLWRARWERDVGDEIDGVLSLDPVTLSYVLEATGPIQASGVTLTPENAADELLNRVYSRYPDPDAQDAWFASVAKRIFEEVSTGVEDPQRLMQALTRGAAEHRLYVHSFRPEEQDELADSAAAGALVTKASDRPQVGIYMNSGSASKMSYYLRYRARVQATWCKAGVQELSGSMTLTSDTPSDISSQPDYVTGGSDLGKVGTQLVIAQIYGPVGGALKELRFDGKPAQVGQVSQHMGRPVYTASVFLDPTQTSEVTWRMRSGPNQTGDVDLSITPSVEARRLSGSEPTACRR